jgi:multicomponent Na+:H+ antiporter subunit G
VGVKEVVIVLLLLAAVGVELVCSLGLLVITDSFDRLHFLGPASTIGSLLVAAAIVVEESLSSNGIKALAAALLLLLTSPILTHATARAARVRQYGHWRALPYEEVDQD